MTRPLDHRCPRCGARAGERCDGSATHHERRTVNDATARDVRYYDLDPTAMPAGHDTPQPDRRYQISAEQNLLNRRGQAMVAAQIAWEAHRRLLRGGLTDAEWQRAQKRRTHPLHDPAADLEQPSIHPRDYQPMDATDAAASHTPTLFGRPR